MGGTPVAVWSGFCAGSSDIEIYHGLLPTQESGMCGPFSVQATGSDAGCHTSTLTVTASPELNGTVIQCSHLGDEVGRATLLVAGNDINNNNSKIGHGFSLSVSPRSSLPHPHPHPKLLH